MSSRAARRLAIGFLARVQQVTGELPSYRYRDPQLASGRELDPTPFVTSLVVHALANVDDPQADAVRARGLAFLRAEREPPGVWRYWHARTGRGIDPDLDDTCCAAFELRRAGDGELAADAAILANRTPHGVFKTWLRAPAAPNDVDSVVNANVLLYLGARAETMPAIDALCRIINAGAEGGTSSYYLDPLALHYMVSRAFHHGVRELASCRARILARLAERMRSGSAGDPLATALAISTAINLDADRPGWLAAAVDTLLAAQAADGSWPAVAFYRGPEPPAPPSVWWASEALTTALCLEALARAS